jgi:hypothetical protein
MPKEIYTAANPPPRPFYLLDLQGRQKGPRVIHTAGWSKMETPVTGLIFRNET